jgi:hypothetical protein
MSQNYLFKLFGNTPKDTDTGVLFMVTIDNSITLPKESNFEINGSPNTITIGKNNKVFIPIALNIDGEFNYNKLSNPILIDKENNNQETLIKKIKEKSDQGNLGDKIVLINKRMLTINKFREYQVNFKLNETKSKDINFARGEDLSAYHSFADITYSQCNKPSSIIETTEVFNPDVNGLKHINMIRHKIIFNF